MINSQETEALQEELHTEEKNLEVLAEQLGIPSSAPLPRPGLSKKEVKRKKEQRKASKTARKRNFK